MFKSAFQSTLTRSLKRSLVAERSLVVERSFAAEATSASTGCMLLSMFYIYYTFYCMNRHNHILTTNLKLNL